MNIDRVSIPRQAKSFTLFAGARAIESPTHAKRVALTAANLLAMNGAPVSILAAPKSTQVLLVQRILFKMIRTTTAFANGGAVSFQYHTTTTSVPHAGSIAATVLTTAGAATTYTFLGPNVGTNGLVIPAGEGIDITNATAPFITGTGTAEVFVEYSVVNVA